MNLSVVTRRILLLITTLCFIHVIGFAQKLHFARNGTAMPVLASDVQYITGSDKEKVGVWMYINSKHLLQFTLYNSTMTVLVQPSLSLDSCNGVQGMDFFQKNNLYYALLQYKAGRKIRTEVFRYNSSDGTLTSSQLISESLVQSGMVVKHSVNGVYTGLMQIYSTTDDSLLIQYSSFKNRLSGKSIAITIPSRNPSLSLESALVDNEGNLFFAVINHPLGSALKDSIVLYKADVQNDSLLTNTITRKGLFSGIQLLQNPATTRLSLCGVWTDENRQQPAKARTSKRYVFVADVNNILSQNSEMTLFAMQKAADSLQVANSNLRLEGVSLYKDSGYAFYICGVSSSNQQPLLVKDYSQSRYKANRSSSYESAVTNNYNTSPSDITEAGNFFRKPKAFAGDPLPGRIYYNPLPYNSQSYPPSNYGVPQSIGSFRPYDLLPAGRNFFMAMITGQKEVRSLVHFTDATPGVSFADYEFVGSTTHAIHYLYSRVLKNEKQLLFDVVSDGEAKPKAIPVIGNSGYRLLIKSGEQVSANSVVFPYLYSKGNISFARLDL